MMKRRTPSRNKQQKIIPKTNTLVNAQTRKVLMKHYRAKYRIK